MQNKLLAALVMTVLAATNVQAACLTTAHAYSGILQPHSTVTAYGPVDVVNGATCRAVVIEVRIGTGMPDVTVEKLEGAVWKRVTKVFGHGQSVVGTAGTYRVLYANKTSRATTYNGSVAFTR